MARPKATKQNLCLGQRLELVSRSMNNVCVKVKTRACSKSKTIAYVNEQYVHQGQDQSLCQGQWPTFISSRSMFVSRSKTRGCVKVKVQSLCQGYRPKLCHSQRPELVSRSKTKACVKVTVQSCIIPTWSLNKLTHSHSNELQSWKPVFVTKMYCISLHVTELQRLLFLPSCMFIQTTLIGLNML